MRFVGHFNPTFHPKRLKEPMKVKKPSIIFADSMSDFWGKGVKQKWRDKVYETMKKCPQHTFLLLTKQPQNIKDTKKIPENVWVGVTITKFHDRWRIANLISKFDKNIYVSIEPILDDIISCYVFCANWVIVGRETGMKNVFMPKEKTIKELISTCKRLNVPLFLKNNLEWEKRIQEFPEFPNWK
jgi:protein gp37